MSPARNANKKPLIMAYIGTDDPHRGDTKISIGLARAVANLMNGQYEYLDKAMLDQFAPHLRNTADQITLYLKGIGAPDIVIGKYTQEIYDAAALKPILTINNISELGQRAQSQGLVSHHLNPELLAREGKNFKKHYPDIKGPLAAVIMGGPFAAPQKLADKLAAIGKNHPGIAFFLCPGRRTGASKNELKRTLKRHDDLHVLDVDYEDAVAENGYNPYLGLLATADHIVVAGESHSSVSEALYTGKNIYLYDSPLDDAALRAKGYISYIDDLLLERPFPTRALPRLDVTGEIAASIVAEYKAKRINSHALSDGKDKVSAS